MARPVKNFVSITVDDMNAYAFMSSTYPGVLHTPNIDRLMAMGTVFENSFAQIAVCNASRTSVLSGLNPSETGVHYNHDNWYDHVGGAQTLPGQFQSAGFATSIIGKVFHQHEMPADIFPQVADYYFRPGGEAFESSSILTTRPSSRPLEQDGDYITVQQAISQMQQAGDNPFALFVGIFKPHLGWVVPQEYFDLYPLDQIVLPFDLDGDLSDVPPFMQAMLYDELHQQVLDESAVKKALQGYLASITFADAMIGLLLDDLEATGRIDDTAVLLWTDHGYHLGDKDNWHKFTLWEEAARSPFILSLPGNNDDGQIVSQVVELVDIMPTVLDAMRLDIPAGLSGRSLMPFIQRPDMIDDGFAITTMYGSVAIRTNDFRYIVYHDGSTELYDIVNDPNQWTNLANDPNFEALKASLDAQLWTELQSDGWVRDVSAPVLVGTDAIDTFIIAAGGQSAEGGGGNDTYFVVDSLATIHELADGGEDTVHSLTSFTLPDHVENLQLAVRSGNATLIGNSQDNTIIGGSQLFGLDGNDYLRIEGGTGTADGGAGNDILFGSQGNNILIGGEGDDQIYSSAGVDILMGGAGNDILVGTGRGGTDIASYEDSVSGVTVDLNIRARTMDVPVFQDTLGAGNDSLFSIEGIIGSQFDDQLTGNSRKNTLSGLAGNDLLSGRGGGDRLSGGQGVDTVSYLRSATSVIIDFASNIGGSSILDTYVSIENAIGSKFGDTIIGGSNNNTLEGMAGDDSINGGEGRDVIFGGMGQDTIDGGAGQDILSGGEGQDRFVFGDGGLNNSRGTADLIVDFDQGLMESIDLNNIDADINLEGHQNFQFIAGSTFSGVAGELRFEYAGGDTFILGDTNGDAASDFMIRLSGIYSLTDADFSGLQAPVLEETPTNLNDTINPNLFMEEMLFNLSDRAFY